MGKVWLVTGSNRGLGCQVAMAALQAGHSVVATGRSLEQLRSVYRDAPAGRIALAELDVVQAAQAKAAIDHAVARFGRIDVLVNNAGYGVLGNFEEVSTADIEAQFAANVFGLMHVTRAALPVMRAQRSGHIFNLSSIGGVAGFAGASVYCASKFAVEGLSASLQAELAPFGIRVTIVEPGFFRTDFLDPSSVRYGAESIADYGAQGAVKAGYDSYSHQQPGDPARLGAALVELAAMAHPPAHFLAGSDALAIVTPVLQQRLAEAQAFAALSRSLDGAF